MYFNHIKRIRSLSPLRDRQQQVIKKILEPQGSGNIHLEK